MLNTTNPSSYEYDTKNLQINMLRGVKANKMESIDITISIQELREHNILRHNIDLYNQNHVEKFTRSIAERLEIGTSKARRTLQDLTEELETFFALRKYEKENQPYQKE